MLGTRTAGLLLSCLLLAPTAGAQQAAFTPAQVGDTLVSLSFRADSQRVAAAAAPEGSLARRPMPTATYLALLSAGVAANAAFPISRDPGTLPDVWLGRDKAIHAVSAFALTESAIVAGVKPGVAALGACAAGAAIEVTQGYISGRDMVANCVGAGGAYLWRRFWRR